MTNHVGEYRIIKNGMLKCIKNAITDLALNAEVQAFLGVNPNIQIKYLAIGTGNAPVDNTATNLQTEIFRTPFISQSVANNEVTTEFVVLNSEAVGAWKEIAIFGGTTATGAANSGKMISRILYTDDKTALEEITIQRVDKIARG